MSKLDIQVTPISFDQGVDPIDNLTQILSFCLIGVLWLMGVFESLV